MKRRSFFKTIASIVGANVLLKLDSLAEIPVPQFANIQEQIIALNKYFTWYYDKYPFRMKNY